MINSGLKDKVIAVLTKHGLTEQRMAKGMYSKDGGISADLTGKKPVIGMMINGKVQPEGNSNGDIDEMQAEVEAIISKSFMKSQSPVPDSSESAKTDKINSDQQKPREMVPAGTLPDAKASKAETTEPKSKLGAGDPPAKKGTTKATCPDCKTIFEISLDEAKALYDKYDGVYCEKCRDKPIEIKHDEAKHQETEKAKDATAEEHKARPEEPKRAEVVKPHLPATRQPDARIPVQAYTPQGSIIKGFQPSLKEIGKIKIGGKGEERAKAGGGTFRLPQKFDHFEIVSLMRDEKGDFIKDPVMQILGENPKELDCMLLFNDPTLNFVTRYNQYQGGKCLCQGDGIKATVSIPDKDGNKIIDCDPDTCPQFAQKKCKPNGILSVILTKSPRLGGVYKFRTTSFNSIRSILSSLFFLSNLTGGVLAMIPLKLTVSPMQVQPKDSAKPQTIFVVNIEFSGTAPELLQKTFDVQKYQSAMRENIIKLECTARAVLTAPESKEEIEDIEAEYYPSEAIK